MNSINVPLVSTLIGDSDFFSNTVGHLKQSVQAFAFRRALVAGYLACSGLLLILALDAHITMLSVSFACCGLWASKRISSKGAAIVVPILMLFNLILWSEAFLALPVAALTMAIQIRLPVNQRSREFLKLSGILGGSATILLMFVREMFQGVAGF